MSAGAQRSLAVGCPVIAGAIAANSIGGWADWPRTTPPIEEKKMHEYGTGSKGRAGLNNRLSVGSGGERHIDKR
jgi:hypothetical protein